MLLKMYPMILFLVFVVKYGIAKVERAITKGERTIVEQVGAPPIVALLDRDEHNYYGFRCAGVLIASQYILSAAHCFRNCSRDSQTDLIESGCMDAYPGKYELSTIDSATEFYSLIEIKIHPDFNDSDSTFYTHDIAIAKLDKPIEDLSATIATLPLNMVPDRINNATIFGWGPLQFEGPIQRSLRHGNVDIQKCNESQFSSTTENNICTLSKEGKGLCQGDSGGPLMCNVYNGNGIQKSVFCGIASGSGENCNETLQSVFAKVDVFKDWISTELRKSISSDSNILKNRKVSSWPKYELIKWNDHKNFKEEPTCNVIEIGSGTEAPCSFPFIINGKTYETCTSDFNLDGLLWCSTLTDNQTNEHIKGGGFWGHCLDGCPFQKSTTINSIKMYPNPPSCISQQNYRHQIAKLTNIIKNQNCVTSESIFSEKVIQWNIDSLNECRSLELSIATELIFQIENPILHLDCSFGIEIEDGNGEKYCGLLEKSFYHKRLQLLLEKGSHYSSFIGECMKLKRVIE